MMPDLHTFEKFVRNKPVRKKSAHSENAHSPYVLDVVRKMVVRKKSAHKLVNQTSTLPARLFRDSLKMCGKNESK
jgi:hypothetical protein